MRIKKTSQTTPVSAQIVDGYSESTTDGYSQNYINNAFGGTILWTNPSPASAFASQTITLSSGDYDVLEIFYSLTYNPTQVKSIKVLKGKNFVLDFYDGYSSKGAIRPVNYTNDTSLSVQNSFYNSTVNSSNYCIPLYIIGYKTGLFN